MRSGLASRAELLVVVLAVFGLSLLGARSLRDDVPAYRFVDINAVLIECKSHQQGEAKVKAKLAQIRWDYLAKMDESQALEAKIEDAVPGTSESEALITQLQHLKVDADLISQLGQPRVEAMSFNLLRNTYEKIQRAAEEYRAKAGLAGVFLAARGPIPPDLKKVDELVQTVYSRPAIAFDPKLDITDDIIKMVNESD